MYFKRKLPDHLIRLASEKGKQLLRQAWEDGTAQNYFPLSEQFTTQEVPSSCGLSSLVMVLNSFEVDPGRQWKGVWRWNSEYNLSGVGQRDLQNISLEQLHRVAKMNSTDSLVVYGKNQTATGRTCSLSTFRHLVTACARRQGFAMILNHSRPVLGQTGVGHFSPLAGYNRLKDMALIFEVARFKYPPYWVHLPLLYRAICQTDTEEDKPRGILLMTRTLGHRSSICALTEDIQAQSHCRLVATHPDAPQTLLDLSDPVLASMVAYYFYQRSVLLDRESTVFPPSSPKQNALFQMANQFKVGEQEVARLLQGFHRKGEKEVQRFFFG